MLEGTHTLCAGAGAIRFISALHTRIYVSASFYIQFILHDYDFLVIVDTFLLDLFQLLLQALYLLCKNPLPFFKKLELRNHRNFDLIGSSINFDGQLCVRLIHRDLKDCLRWSQ